MCVVLLMMKYDVVLIKMAVSAFRVSVFNSAHTHKKGIKDESIKTPKVSINCFGITLLSPVHAVGAVYDFSSR